MGFSSVVGTTIMIVALLICGAYLYVTIDSYYENVDSAYTQYYNHLHAKLDERLVITNVVSSPTQTNITIYNNGSVVVIPENFTILFDGTVVPKENISYYPQPKKYLVPLDSITLIINWTQPTRICVVSNNGNKYFYLI